MAKPPADEAIIRVNLLASRQLRARPAKTNVGDLVLSARRRAAAEMNADFVFIPTARRLQLLDQTDHPVFGFRDGEIAKLDAGAAHAALAEVGRFVNQAVGVQLGFERVEVCFRHVDDE